MAASATAADPAPVPAVGPASLAGVRVLVVDDDPDARELLRVMLGKYGADVATAASVEEALDLISRQAPDVLVSDIGLPTEDGYALIRRIRGAPETSRLPALALTAYATANDHRRALEAGFQKHVAKPVEPAELAGIVAAMVAESRARAQAGGSSATTGGTPLLSLAAAAR